MSKQNYYSLLGVSPDATEAEIKQSYRALARKYHPDSGSAQGSNIRFQSITEAYRVLKNSTLRKRYDIKYGFNAYDEHNSAANFAQNGANDPKVNQDKPFVSSRKPSNSSDLFDAQNINSNRSGAESPNRQESSQTFMSKLRNQFIKSGRVQSKAQHISKRSSNKSTSQIHPRDLEDELLGSRSYRFTIDALESIRGTSREIALKDNNTQRMIRVKIPQGISDQATLKVDVPNHPPLHISIHIKPHRYVKREGYNIVIKIPLTIGEALNGVEILIPTLSGSVQVHIPPRGERNKRLRLKGRGLENPSTGEAGDLYIQTDIVVPDNLNKTTREAAKKFDDNYTEPVRKNIPKQLL